MKFLHTADWHVGRKLHGYDLSTEQADALRKLEKIAIDEKVDAIVIAGDIYDRGMPSEDSVRMVNGALKKLNLEDGFPLLAISGNHDSAVKLSFASGLIDLSGIHIAPVYNGKVEPMRLEGYDGISADIYMLPFVKPVTVKNIFKDEAEDIKDYTSACRVAIEHMDIDEIATNILVAHQFVTGAERSDSEENIGGLDNVDVGVFAPFDYVALGHIHGPQKVGRDTVRYSGTPLKYSLSEAKHHKSVTVIDIPENKKIELRTVELVPMRDLREIKGTFAELTDKAYYEGTAVEDYIYVVLTDEEDIPDALGKLRVIYPNIMKLRYDNTRTRTDNIIEEGAVLEGKQPIDLFEELYEKQNNKSMSPEQREFMEELINKVFKEEA